MEVPPKGVGFTIGLIQRATRARVNRVVREADLTKPQMDVMLFLKRREEKGQRVIQRDLENYFQITNPTVSSMISRLEAKNLIERVSDPHDRRIRQIILTPKAKDLIARFNDTIQEVEGTMLEGISVQELEQGKAFLEKILHNLQSKEEDKLDCHSCQTD